MTLLTISAGELRRVAGLASTDTSADAALALVQTAEQLAVEYTIDPAALALIYSDAGLAAVLTLGVAEALVASYLGQLARDPAALGGSVIGPIRISPPNVQEWQTFSVALAAKSAARLAPWLRNAGSYARAAIEPLGTDGIDPAPPIDLLLGSRAAADVSGIGIWGDDGGLS